MTTKRIHGRAFVDGVVRDDVLVTISGTVISDVEVVAQRPPDADKVSGVIVPGFVDAHVHGGDGGDFTDGDADGIGRIVRLHARHGTTALAATTLSASPERLRSAVGAIAEFVKSPAPGAEICAIHFEGPYLSPNNAGAQDRASIREADLTEFAALLDSGPDLNWMMTVAPEVNGVRRLVEQYSDRVTFSIGHTAGDYSDAAAALSWGASHFTHLFNAMTGLHHREPGTVGAALASAHATAELIADGIHVHPAALRIASQAMRRRTVLVTDAMRACGLPDGTYKLYDYDVVVADGAARLTNGVLAGSVLTMDRAIQNMIELAGVPFEVVIPMATSIPARVIGVADRKGQIEKGFDADLVVLSTRFEVERVWARGRELTA